MKEGNEVREHNGVKSSVAEGKRILFRQDDGGERHSAQEYSSKSLSKLNISVSSLNTPADASPCPWLRAGPPHLFLRLFEVSCPGTSVIGLSQVQLL